MLFTRLKKMKLRAHTYIHPQLCPPGGVGGRRVEHSNYYLLQRCGVICGLWSERVSKGWGRGDFQLLTLLVSEDPPKGCFLSLY